ncbi:MAG TPA: alpha/beta hydrolase [Gammaproteobacteria bacterium]|nr:alpha/beta hydrolase [Gammaproteobacteria bacterium]
MNLQTLSIGPERLNVHYYRAGQGEPLLYLHHMLGLTGFEPVLEALAARYEVIAPYAPGWGPAKDDLPRIDPGPLDITLHNVDLLDTLGIDAAHVVGVSIGAWMAAELAAIQPARVRKLVLVNPIGLWLEDAAGEDPFAQHPGFPSRVQFANPKGREDLLIGDRDKMDAHVEELLNLRASAKFLWPIPDTGVKRRLGRINAPTLVVTSSEDKIVTAAHGPAWQSRIAGAKLAQLAGAGHGVQLEQPAALAAMVQGFLTTTH